MLTVEIRGAGEDTAGSQNSQRVFQQTIPCRWREPVILVADEDEIEQRQLLHAVDR